MTKAYAVLRSGGDFRPEHVHRLVDSIPGLIVLSDVDVPGVDRIPLKHNWPGWFSKFELFRPDIEGDVFFVDLDTVIVGDISDMRSTGKTTMLSDFYYQTRPASGVMYITEDDRRKVWKEWIKHPDLHMIRCGTLGDQILIGSILKSCARWQDEFPGRIVSYKMHVCEKGTNRRALGNGQVPDGASIVCFHGKPRPWEIDNL